MSFVNSLQHKEAFFEEIKFLKETCELSTGNDFINYISLCPLNGKLF